MGNAVTLGSTGSGHSGFPPTDVITAASTVKIDGKAAARKGDMLMMHAKPKHPPHPRFISGGSSSVFIEGKPAARDGDAVGCGGSMIGGGSVNIG